MISIFHAFRGWSDVVGVRVSCCHWPLGSLASWEYIAVCCPGVIHVCREAALLPHQRENWFPGMEGTLCAAFVLAGVTVPQCVCVDETTSLFSGDEGDDTNLLAPMVSSTCYPLLRTPVFLNIST